MRYLIILTLSLLSQTLFVADAISQLAFRAIGEKDDLRSILIIGRFTRNDDLQEFESLIQQHRPTVVTLLSPGGNLAKAIELGRMIRKYKLTTLLPDNFRCVSACAFAFLGGADRFADAGTIGVHRPSIDPKAPVDKDVLILLGQMEMLAYLEEMGVHSEFLELMFRYKPDDMRYLSKSEMNQLRVTTIMAAQKQDSGPPSVTQKPIFKLPPDANPDPQRSQNPQALSGKVRHPDGAAPIKSVASDWASDVALLANRTPLTIQGRQGPWYRVGSSQGTGYIHYTWVKVDQYEPGNFEDRYIQVKSTKTLAEAEKYVRQSALNLDVFRTVNGWFAVALPETFPRDHAVALASKLKAKGLVPSDSFVTYGNNYMRRVCCSKWDAEYPEQQVDQATPSDRASKLEVHFFNYGQFDKSCWYWTDGCRNCLKRKVGGIACSNIGFSCSPKEIKCVKRLGQP